MEVSISNKLKVEQHTRHFP